MDISRTATLYPNAILLPALALSSWLLCIPPFIWHYTQRNIPAWSLMLYLIFTNLINFINPLIWPRDNLAEWWDGAGLCDIEVRFHVAMSVGLPACTAMIMRKLAKVMDTNNMTLGPSRSQERRQKILEMFMCWGYPLLLAILYYVVQPVRYYIYGISGCAAAFNLSWVSVVLSTMWPPVTTVFTAYYAGLLVYRLYRYRQDFARLIAASDTTRSRFLRLFMMGTFIVLVVTPYSFWILWLFSSKLTEQFSWEYVHGNWGPGWNSVAKAPAHGEVRVDRWGQAVAGYFAFIVFGTGTDAKNTYKRILCSIGLGRIFPGLYKRSSSGSTRPGRFWSWCTSTGNKVRTLFSMNDSVTETTTSQTLTNNSAEPYDALTLNIPLSGSLQPVYTP